MHEWPEWLTEEHRNIHTAIENEIKKALWHCYASADSAGMDWTTEGWISCSASNIMSFMKKYDLRPPRVGSQEITPMPEYALEEYEDWAVEDADDQWAEVDALFGRNDGD